MHSEDLKTLLAALETAADNLYHLEFTPEGRTLVVEHPLVKNIEELINKIQAQ